MYASQRTGRWIGRMAALLATVSLVLGCSLVGLGGSEGDSSSEPVEVHVTNYNWSTVHVYAYGGGQRASLGLLSTNQSATWEVPASLLSANRDLRLIADPVGSAESHVSERIMYQPGDRIEWTLQNSLVQSSVMVR